MLLDGPQGESSNIRFSIQPLPGDTGFSQWVSAMKMVAQLHGGIPPEFRKRLWLQLADRHLVAKGTYFYIGTIVISRFFARYAKFWGIKRHLYDICPVYEDSSLHSPVVSLQFRRGSTEPDLNFEHVTNIVLNIPKCHNEKTKFS